MKKIAVLVFVAALAATLLVLFTLEKKETEIEKTVSEEGNIADEAEAARNEFRKTGGLEWSALSEKKVFHADAETACNELKESGHDDWRLPSIDELRTLVQNHPGTVSGGKCRVLEENILSGDYEKEPCDEKNYEIIMEKYFDENCKGIEGSGFSKLGDTDALWSGTAVCNPFRANVWGLDFNNGGISSYAGSDDGQVSLKFRCVRQDDADACETARRGSTAYSWRYYLRFFENGKCAAEARAFLKK